MPLLAFHSEALEFAEALGSFHFSKFSELEVSVVELLVTRARETRLFFLFVRRIASS